MPKEQFQKCRLGNSKVFRSIFKSCQFTLSWRFYNPRKGLDNIFLYSGKLSLGFRAFLALEHFLCPIKIGFGSAGTVTNFPFTLFTTVINCASRRRTRATQISYGPPNFRVVCREAPRKMSLSLIKICTMFLT